MDIKNMTTEEYQAHLLREVVEKVNAHKQGDFEQVEQVETDKWGDHEYLKTLSTEEINSNWEKVQEAFKNNK